MNQTPINQQRKAEAQKLKQILAIGLVGSILLHLIGFLLLSLSQTFWSEVPEESEAIIELTTVDPQDVIAAADTEPAGSGDGDSNSQFSPFNATSSEPDVVDTIVASTPSTSPEPLTHPVPPEEPKKAERTEPSPIYPPFTALSPSVLPTPISSPSPSPQSSAAPRPSASASTAPSSVVKMTASGKRGQSAPSSTTQSLNQKTQGAAVQRKGSSGPSLSLGSEKGNGTGSGISIGIGRGQGSRSITGTGNRVGVGTSNRTGSGNRLKATQSAPSPASSAFTTPQAIEKKLSPSSKRKPRCLKNCGLDRYLGAEGSARFEFDVDASGKVTNVKLKQSSGNAEVDRKAEAAVRKRKYEASDSGFSSKIRVTSELEGSDFQKQQMERRRQDAVLQAEQTRRNVEQAQLEHEQSKPIIIQPQSTSKPLPKEIKPTQPKPITVPSPVLPSQPSSVPESVLAPSIPEPVDIPSSLPERATPEPVSEPLPENITEPPATTPITKPLPEAPIIEPVPSIQPSAP